MASRAQQGFVFAVLCFVVAPLYGDGQGGEPDELELLEVGPADFRNEIPSEPFDVPTLAMGNVARDPSAIPFGSRSNNGNLHETLIDGLYEGTWRGNAGTESTQMDGVLENCGAVNCALPPNLQCSYAGVYWPTAVDVHEIALGSNNRSTDGTGAITQRNYIIQVTTQTFAPVVCSFEQPTCDDSANVAPAVTWTTIGKARAHLVGPLEEKTLRHRYRIDPPQLGVHAVRIIKVQNDDIDEIEVGNDANTLGDPPPTSLVLRETGGPYTTPAASGDVPSEVDGNLARAAGSVGFASSQTDVANLTDGSYGTAWVGANGPTSGITYAGVYFGGTLQTVGEIAISRDNTGGLNDSVSGTHTVQSTTDIIGDPSSDASVSAATWTDLPTKFVAAAHRDAAVSCRGLRHRYVLNVPLVDITGIRVVTAEGNVLDELEVGAAILGNPDEIGPVLALTEGPGPTADTAPLCQDGNFSRATDAVAFASQPGSGHLISFLSDGTYGDSNAWVGGNSQPGPATGVAYAGVYWAGGLRTIKGVALGRDNSLTGGHNNRHTGVHVVHYTTDDLGFEEADMDPLDPGVDNVIAAAKWIEIGTLRTHIPIPQPPNPDDRGLRRGYNFPAPVAARAIRVITAVTNAIDELEFFGDPPVGPDECDPIVVGNENLPGDCNQDGTVDLSDVICVLGFLFQNNPLTLPCTTDPANLALMDCNNDGFIDLSDAIYKLSFLFQGGLPPVQGVDCITIMDCPENLLGCP